jgi:hypothetical protein
MNCKFCNLELESKSFQYINYMVCNHHKPAIVGYRRTDLSGDKWTVIYGDYSLYYNKGKTWFRKINKGSERARDYYTIIKKFDHELNIKPEDFSKKLPTLLTFL